MDWTELLGFTTGALCVWLTVRRSVWNFPVGVANNAFFIVPFVGADRGPLVVRRNPRWVWLVAVVRVYLHKGPTLTAVLYLGFLGLCLVGLRQWWRTSEEAPVTVVVHERSVVS